MSDNTRSTLSAWEMYLKSVSFFMHHPLWDKIPSIFTADVSALYTNLNVAECFNSVMELVEEHWNSLSAYDLTRVEIRSILEVIL